MTTKFIPNPDDDFDHWVTKFYTWVNSHGTSHGLSAAQITAFTTLWNTWNTEWSDFNTAEAAYHAATQAKDSARNPLEESARALAAIIQKDPNTTNEDRTAAGLTVPSGTRTPSTTPGTIPVLQEVDASTRCILRLFITDSETPESRAKPANARCVEIREQIGGTAPVNPETMDFLAMESRMPYRADFDAADAAKTVWFAFRWIGKNNQPGPWSTIYEKAIPA